MTWFHMVNGYVYIDIVGGIITYSQWMIKCLVRFMEFNGVLCFSISFIYLFFLRLV